MEEIYCQGCGIQIQTQMPDKIGYAPETAFQKEPVLCQRCFRLKHYNQVQPVSIQDEDFLNFVSQIRQTSSLVIHLVDVFDISGSIIHNLPRITGNNPIILVGNKVDLLPKSTNKRNLIQRLRAAAKEAGLRVKDVFLISSEKGKGIDELSEAMEHHRGQKDIHIVGTTNVGKSTFINRLIKRTSGERDIITTSYFPGTTLGFIEIPLDSSTSLIDTPGIVNKRQIAHYVSEHDLKLITPKKEIKPSVYQLNSNQSLFIGGLARLDYNKGDKQSFVCYFANEIPLHRTKLENADALYDNHQGGLLTPPDEQTLQKLPAFDTTMHHLKKEKIDIVFPGLGWISIDAEEATITVHSPKNVSISLRKALI